MRRPMIFIGGERRRGGVAPPVTNTAVHPNWTYTAISTSGGGLVDVANSNPSGGSIHFSGPITNPTGTTLIVSGGSVLADGPAP